MGTADGKTAGDRPPRYGGDVRMSHAPRVADEASRPVRRYGGDVRVSADEWVKDERTGQMRLSEKASRGRGKTSSDWPARMRSIPTRPPRQTRSVIRVARPHRRYRVIRIWCGHRDDRSRVGAFYGPVDAARRPQAGQCPGRDFSRWPGPQHPVRDAEQDCYQRGNACYEQPVPGVMRVGVCRDGERGEGDAERHECGPVPVSPPAQCGRAIRPSGSSGPRMTNRNRSSPLRIARRARRICRR